jgi:heme/copper-type cytochrome/quinol oxidase subunit 2
MSTACEHTEGEHAATRRLTVATWTLVAATVALVVVTMALCAATYAEKQHHEPAATTEVATTQR